EDRPVADEKSAPTLENFSNNSRAGQTPDTDGAAVRVGSVQVETQADIDHGIFQTAIEPFLGNKATQGDLAKLAQKIADVARAKGMVLADAYIPAQNIEMGMVKVILTVGVIDEVRIVGSSSRALRNLLAPLEGMERMGNELERRLLLANAIPQIYVDKTEVVTEGARRVLVVKVTEVKKLSGQFTIDNLGSSDIGPLRARLSVDAVDLIDISDSLNVTLRTNPTDPDELAVASAVYGVAVNNEGTRAEIAAAWSDSNIAPRSGFDRRTGTSAYGSFSVNHPARRSATATLRCCPPVQPMATV
ncbi:MAG: hypothetical protein K6T70_10595, partial [Meiothermus ruber]|uniref:POTRA domain-containing protein n=1 Tax=Meiothermus ruber TaxID=277 RepID=UPI0023F630F6